VARQFRLVSAGSSHLDAELTLPPLRVRHSGLACFEALLAPAYCAEHLYREAFRHLEPTLFGAKQSS
jgi:hypothetical protein